MKAIAVLKEYNLYLKRNIRSNEEIEENEIIERNK